MQAVEDAYRTALAGTAPGLLKKATCRGLLLFVEEMFDLLTGSLNGCSICRPAMFSTQDILEIIATLILSAAPSTQLSARWRGSARGIRLWATLLSLIPEHVGAALEETSIRWPAALRRRFLSVLHRRTQQRWPYSPYRKAALVGTPVKRAEIAELYGLTAPVRHVANGLSSI